MVGKPAVWSVIRTPHINFQLPTPNSQLPTNGGATRAPPTPSLSLGLRTLALGLGLGVGSWELGVVLGAGVKELAPEPDYFPTHGTAAPNPAAADPQGC